MSRAAEYVRRRLRQSQGFPAVITRGQDSCDCTAVFGHVEGVAVTLQETRIVSDAQDLLIESAEYKPAGDVVEPADNDRIVVTTDEGEFAFDVRTPGTSGKCFQRADPTGSELRVHCRLVQPEGDEV